MRSGKLRHLLSIEQPAISQSSSGDTTKVWTEFAEVYGHVSPVKGDELWNAEAVQPQIRHKVCIRFLEGLTSDMRIIHRGRTLEISEPPANVDERDREMTFICIEKT